MESTGGQTIKRIRGLSSFSPKEHQARWNRALELATEQHPNSQIKRHSYYGGAFFVEVRNEGDTFSEVVEVEGA